MLWPSALTIGGTTIDLTWVLADVTVRHGREDVYSDPTPSTCQVVILGATHAQVKAFQVGAPLVLTVRDGAGAAAPRFTGTVTDGGLDVDNLTVIAVGKLASLGDYKIGTAGVVWPVETWSARVQRCFAEAGLSSLLELQPDPAFDPQLAARDSATAGATTLRDYLGFLAPMVGAAIADRPDGKILVQAMGARTIAAATALAPADIAYAPAWEIVMPAGNIVTVRYTGDQSQSVTVTDAASVTQYGPQPATIDTTYVNAADATTRANLRLARSAYAHWNMPKAPVLRGLTLAIGTPVQLSSMPAPSPFDPWTPILEGWTDTISAGDPAGLGTWTMELGLSDPLASGLVLPWNAVPPAGYAWNQINPATAWSAALTLDDLAPV